MGSLNNGSIIAQTRATIRNIGRAYTESRDRVETGTTVYADVLIGDNADLTLTQYTANMVDPTCTKITDSYTDSLVVRDCLEDFD